MARSPLGFIYKAIEFFHELGFESLNFFAGLQNAFRLTPLDVQKIPVKPTT